MITVANHQLITIIRFVAKSYTHPWRSFANKLYLVLYACEILFLGNVHSRNPRILGLNQTRPLITSVKHMEKTKPINQTSNGWIYLYHNTHILSYIDHPLFFIKCAKDLRIFVIKVERFVIDNAHQTTTLGYGLQDYSCGLDHPSERNQSSILHKW